MIAIALLFVVQPSKIRDVDFTRAGTPRRGQSVPRPAEEGGANLARDGSSLIGLEPVVCLGSECEIERGHRLRRLPWSGQPQREALGLGIDGTALDSCRHVGGQERLSQIEG